MISYLELIYSPMKAKQGKNHIYLVMHLEFTEKGTVKIPIHRYIDDSTEELFEDITTSVVSSTEANLLYINNNRKSLRK